MWWPFNNEVWGIPVGVGILPSCMYGGLWVTEGVLGRGEEKQDEREAKLGDHKAPLCFLYLCPWTQKGLSRFSGPRWGCLIDFTVTEKTLRRLAYSAWGQARQWQGRFSWPNISWAALSPLLHSVSTRISRVFQSPVLSRILLSQFRENHPSLIINHSGLPSAKIFLSWLGKNPTLDVSFW